MTRLVTAVLLLAVAVAPARAAEARTPKNIIVMIGDGMGLAQITAARTHQGSLALDEFKHIGLVLTHAHGDDYITDSAASSTAMATGVLTYNGAIGVGPDSSAVESAMEVAQRNGVATGLVATCSVTHATPACFVAHVPSRRMEFEIARQIALSGTDVILGSGWGWFLPPERGGRREDGVDLIATMQERGYTYVSTPSGFHGLDLAEIGRLIGLFEPGHCASAPQRDPSLREMADAAIAVLSRSRAGFFLMIEGSQIDWAGHDNDASQVVKEMADFDDAITGVLDFAGRHADTLVIVTGDHETGGYALVDGSVSERSVVGRFASDRHTGTMIPVFAKGPGAERFQGIHTVADIGQILLDMVR